MRLPTFGTGAPFQPFKLEVPRLSRIGFGQFENDEIPVLLIVLSVLDDLGVKGAFGIDLGENSEHIGDT